MLRKRLAPLFRRKPESSNGLIKRIHSFCTPDFTEVIKNFLSTC